MIAAPLVLEGVTHRDVRVNGVRLHVAEAGPHDAPALLLAHGWPQNWWCWRRLAPLLTPRFRCLMPDFRGHGGSEAPVRGYEKDELARDLVELLDALELDQVGFIGHDWGAYVGMLIGMESPQRISALLAMSIAHPWPSWRDRLNPVRLAAFSYQLPLSTPVLGERLMRAGATRQILRRGSPPGTYSDEDLAVFDEPMRSPQGARATVSLYRTFLLRELPAIAAGRFRKARLTVPTVLLVGEKDAIVRGADLRGFEPHAPRMTVERVPAAGHFLPEECPEVVAEHAEALFGAKNCGGD